MHSTLGTSCGLRTPPDASNLEKSTANKLRYNIRPLIASTWLAVENL
jgi:hypothetical protein